MAGPATNTTTIGAIWGRFGWRVLGTYLTTIVVGSMVAALLFDWLVPISLPGIVADGHHHHVNWFAQLCAAFLVVLSAFFGFEWLKNRSVKEQPQNEESSLPKVEEASNCVVSGVSGISPEMLSLRRKLQSRAERLT